jgi:hypothetical protein
VNVCSPFCSSPNPYAIPPGAAPRHACDGYQVDVVEILELGAPHVSQEHPRGGNVFAKHLNKEISWDTVEYHELTDYIIYYIQYEYIYIYINT